MTIFKKRPLTAVALGALFVGAISCGSTTDAGQKVVDPAGNPAAKTGCAANTTPNGCEDDSLGCVWTAAACVAKTVPTTAAGTTFQLTHDADSFVGTVDNDTFNDGAKMASSTLTDTLQGIDVLDGAGGVDTLNASLIGNVVTITPTLKNVEVLNITNTTTAVTIGGNSVSGLTTVNSSNSTMLSTIGGAAGAVGAAGLNLKTALTTVGLTNHALGLKLFFEDLALTGAADTLTVNLEGVGSSATSAPLTVDTVTTGGSDYETLTINSAGSSTNYLTYASTGGGTLANVTINGAAGLVMAELPVTTATAVTINASASTGGVYITTNAANNTTTFTGGSGNDRVVFASGNFTTADSVNGGTGTDTLALAEAAPFAVAPTNLTAVEVLEFTNATPTQNLALVGNSITHFLMSGTGGSLALTGGLSTYYYTLSGATPAAFSSTLLSDTVADTLNVTLLNSDPTTLTATSYETVNLVSSPSALGVLGGSANVITTLTNTAASTINISGASHLTVTTLAAAGTVAASTFTGNLTITTGSVAASLYTGGSGNDVITTGVGNDTVVGGAGNDTLQVSNGATAATANVTDTLTGGTGADTFKFVEPYATSTAASLILLLAQSAGATGVVSITDFVAGTDKIFLNTGVTAFTAPSMTLATAQTITTAANLAAVYTAIASTVPASANTGALSGVVVTVTGGALAGRSYLFVNDVTTAATTADMLIDITGFTGTLTNADFSFT